jgi:hypothetical protein
MLCACNIRISLQECNTCEPLGLPPIVYVSKFMIMFVYGHAIDAYDEYCKLGELITMVSLKGFVVG